MSFKRVKAERAGLIEQAANAMNKTRIESRQSPKAGDVTQDGKRASPSTKKWTWEETRKRQPLG